MTDRETHEELGDKLERETRDMEQRAGGLGEDIDDVRSKWEAKRRDPAVPGADPPEDEESGDSSD